jgi:hypothetical protein
MLVRPQAVRFTSDTPSVVYEACPSNCTGGLSAKLALSCCTVERHRRCAQEARRRAADERLHHSVQCDSAHLHGSAVRQQGWCYVCLLLATQPSVGMQPLLEGREPVWRMQGRCLLLSRLPAGTLEGRAQSCMSHSQIANIACLIDSHGRINFFAQCFDGLQRL